jgi:hypothetical protein
VAVAFFIARCFTGVCDGEGDSAGLGDCACEIQIPANPITAMTAEIFVVISASVRRRSDNSQSNSGDTRSGRGTERNFIARPLSEPVVCATLCPVDLTLGCLKWAAVGFVVAFALMKLFEASQIHDDIPKPAFKIRQTKRATFVLSTFAAVLSGLVWLLVQKLD